MLQKTVQKMFEKPKQEFVVVNMEEGVKKAGLKDVLPVEVALFLTYPITCICILVFVFFRCGLRLLQCAS